MTYTSKGTVRVEFEVGDDDRLAAAAKELLFVPDGDYSIKHGKKTFAVFVPHSGRPIFREYGQDKEIRIATNQVPPYDCTKTKVEIEVEELPTVSADDAAGVVAATNAMSEAMTKLNEAAADDRAAASEFLERWKAWNQAVENARTVMMVALKLISITMPAAK